MTVYFSATITEDAEAKALYEKVFDFLKKEGYEVLGYKQEKLSPTELTDRTEEEMKNASKMLQDNMNKAEIYIADITYPSVGIGFEIKQALTNNTPTLILQNINRQERNDTIDLFIQQYKEKLTYLEYSGTEELLSLLLSFLKTVS